LLDRADTTTYEKVFASCRTGNVDEVKASLEQFKKEHPSLEVPLVPVTILAMRDRHAKILQFCLDEGPIFENSLLTAAGQLEEANDDQATLEVLANSQLRKLIPKRKRRDDVNKRHLALGEQEKPPKMNPDGSYHIDQIEEWFHDIPF